MSLTLYSWNRAQVPIVQEAGGAPRTGLDGCGEGKVSCPHSGLNPELSWPFIAILTMPWGFNCSDPNSALEHCVFTF